MAVDRKRSFAGYKRSMPGDGEGEGVVQAARGSLQKPDLDVDSGCSQARDASPADRGIRIEGCHHTARDAGGDERVGTGPGAAVVAAGFERDVSCRSGGCGRSGCVESCVLQCDDLRVVEAVVQVRSRAEDLAIPHQNASDLRIWRRETDRCFGEFKRLLHEFFVVRQAYLVRQRSLPGRSDSHTVSAANSAAKVHSVTVRVS